MRIPALLLRVVLGSIAGGAVVMASVLALGHHTTSHGLLASAAAASSNNCVTRATTFLNTHDLVGFAVITQVIYPAFPYRGSVRGSRPPLFVTGFRAGRLTGFIANIAVHGPDRPAEDAYARSLGYRVGRWPLVPLQGPVVRHNPGLLEVYETAFAFKSKAAARAWIKSRRGSARLDPRSRLIDLPDRSSSGVAYRTVFGPDDGAHEHVISYAERFGSRGLVVDFQGGVELSPNLVNPYWNTASARLRQACGRVPTSEVRT